MSDSEMRHLNIRPLVDDGLIFLWVTHRAMELGRECLKIWGFSRVEELIWVKTNQLKRLRKTGTPCIIPNLLHISYVIEPGRTGHWLNHSKEHCLVGVKGKPSLPNKLLDCDVIVSEVRETSKKPDEIYKLIERLSPGGRKLGMYSSSINSEKFR